MKSEDLKEIFDLEKEIDEFFQGMKESKDDAEFEMYRQMIKVNISIIKGMLNKKER